MRRFATLGLMLTLAGCGYHTWWNPPFTTGYQPYRPTGDAENLRRAQGIAVDVSPLNPQPGDVWPGPLRPTPTLQDLEQQGTAGTGQEQPPRGSPLGRGAAGQAAPPSLPPEVTRGSSAPPGSSQPGLASLPPQQPVTAPPGPTVPRPPAPGQVVPMPGGAGVTGGGTTGYQTMTLPGGGTAIVVPNGNGTSTVIKSDGSIETIPTPK